jgi:hypothetical protein
MCGIVPEGPWTAPLNWDLHATTFGEVHIPFALYVRTAPTQPTTFTFMKLPTELQFRIMHFCDSATLFQLMHVCSNTRKEARKLFLSGTDVWYFIHAPWILAGGFAGHTYYDTEPLAHVQQIEMDFGRDYSILRRLDNLVWRDSVPHTGPKPDIPGSGKEQRVHEFWQLLKCKFPCATSVVLSESRREIDEFGLPDWLAYMAEKCPSGITTFVSILRTQAEHPMRAKRSLWQLSRNRDDTTMDWEMINPNWRRKSILPPVKGFRGPVGKFCRVGYWDERVAYQDWARRLLLIHAVEAYHLKTGRRVTACPVNGCNWEHETHGEWASHVIDAGHDLDIALPSSELETLFAQREARLTRLKEKSREELIEMRLRWGKEGSEERENAEHAFLNQLQHDPLYTREFGPRESLIWRYYQHMMNADGDWSWEHP